MYKPVIADENYEKLYQLTMVHVFNKVWDFFGSFEKTSLREVQG